MRALVESGKMHWDVVDLEMTDAVSGCDEGLLDRVGPGASLPAPDVTPVVVDFPRDGSGPGASSCGPRSGQRRAQPSSTTQEAGR